MPRFNPFTGEALMGVAGTQPSVDGTSYGPGGSTSPTVWLDRDTILHQVTGVINKTNIRTLTTTALTGAANELSAGCKGTYLAWNAVNGLLGAITLPLGGLNRVITDARGANANDGTLAYIAVRTDPGPTLLRHPTKPSIKVEIPGDPFGMHILKWGQAVWNDLATVGVLQFWGTTCAYIPGASYAKIAKLGSDLWIMYGLSGIGLVVHKAINPAVYYIVTAGAAFHPDFIAYNGKLAVCYSTNVGETSGALVKQMDVVGTFGPGTAVPGNIVPGGGHAGPAVPPDDLPLEQLTGVFPQFADLQVVLAQAKDLDNPLYQTIQVMIERLTDTRLTMKGQIGQLERRSDTGNNNIINKLGIQTFLTKEDERLTLANSVQVLAGTGIVFDDTDPNKRIIIANGLGTHYDSPLSDGDLTSASLIFASGECIIVQVPV